MVGCRGLSAAGKSMLQARDLRLAVLLLGSTLATPAPAGTLAVVANYRDNAAAIVDTACRPTFAQPCESVLATVAVGNAPYAVAFRQDGARAYVTNSHDDSVSVIAAFWPSASTWSAVVVENRCRIRATIPVQPV